ncbi:DUF4258 domain-containing protein [Ornithobacterium rhinotracheale]|uniref:DUF4258 domain-containing protein n=1 Tax=Ornithobacterium rhinotracheale (strain ATCC 51463 / DSM 15997 / CCUG 23171 / CIP 104009 / LMG 9086) TaxID=867902 RepID=I3ZZ98_ORNRL|nr:DUF4258 domain-containing protein [Ornithobacterium rhinotracheale]AFL97032.1 hypothetical protein Ornrh_0836 [Ornithobacterium rhinotracheale DSM 15997]AIQ00437.1 hypothetical protein Q785_04740 [Ornithobacterium rhinotracheale ORT-UMN 88]KGB67390.1 hypothetical protein Q787_04615 [Ornithobacterium rhinotracheale H06-030791]MCK0194450.1 DUF4258 domain-containing protein [Ornithobacterium rhinotracheale]MCK0199585.1 DUF4258 domain-containing protein [Ornithobacterium rhinotracheale]
MSDFQRRFKFFGIGILLGIFVVILMFGKRNSCRNYLSDYLPNGRVLSEVSFLPKEYSPQAQEQMQALGIDTAFFNQKILKKGIIDFDRSAPRQEPCGAYIMNYQDKEKSVEIIFKKCKDKVLIESFKNEK